MNWMIDLKKEFIAAKAKEDIIGFAGFRLAVDRIDHPVEGNLIISSRRRDDGSGYLTLTFLIDAEDDLPANSAVSDLFKRVKITGSLADLGRQFESMVETPVELDKSDNWFMDSFTFFSAPLSNIKMRDVEEKLLPAFVELLPIAFDSVEWLPENVSQSAARGPESKKSSRSFKDFLKTWFDSK